MITVFIMRSGERRAREKEALRSHIMDAARDLFVEQGYESASMRKIAERIDYSPTAIYLHFKDKAALLHSICDETFLKLSSALEILTKRMESGKYDVVEGLKKGLHVYVEFGLSHPNHYRLTFLTRYETPDFADGSSTGFQAFSHLERGVQACVDANRFRATHVPEISQALWAGVHGVTALLIQHPGFPFVARKKLIKRVIDSMVDGLAK